MVPYFLAEHPNTAISFLGATFGSPGAGKGFHVNPELDLDPDSRLTHFANTRDVVPALGLNLPDSIDLYLDAAAAVGAILTGSFNQAIGLVAQLVASAGFVAVGSQGASSESGFYDYNGRSLWLDTPLNEWGNTTQEHSMSLYVEEVWRLASLEMQPIFSINGAWPAIDLAHAIVGYRNQANGSFFGQFDFLDGDTWGVDRVEYIVGGVQADALQGGSRGDWMWGLDGKAYAQQYDAAHTQFNAALIELQRAPHNAPLIARNLEMAEIQAGLFDTALGSRNDIAKLTAPRAINVARINERLLELFDEITNQFAGVKV